MSWRGEGSCGLAGGWSDPTCSNTACHDENTILFLNPLVKLHDNVKQSEGKSGHLVAGIQAVKSYCAACNPVLLVLILPLTNKISVTGLRDS